MKALQTLEWMMSKRGKVAHLKLRRLIIRLSGKVATFYQTEKRHQRITSIKRFRVTKSTTTLTAVIIIVIRKLCPNLILLEHSLTSKTMNLLRNRL